MPDEVILIDAYSQIFRAFFAIRMLTNSRGEPTNALFVFTRLLLHIQQNYPAKRLRQGGIPAGTQSGIQGEPASDAGCAPCPDSGDPGHGGGVRLAAAGGAGV